jgi:hypothetical protein
MTRPARAPERRTAPRLAHWVGFVAGLAWALTILAPIIGPAYREFTCNPATTTECYHP